MNLAEPAPLVDPAKAAPAAVDDDDEYRVEPALEAKDEYKVESIKVDAAVPLDDPRKFAPTKQIDEPHRNPDFDISVDKLRSGAGGVSFENEAAVCRGTNVTCTRACFPSFYALFDGFVSYGEVARYVVIKDNFCFVYGHVTDPNPIYSVPIDTLKAVKEDPNKPLNGSIRVSPIAGQTLQTFFLVDARDSIAYQFSFDVSKDAEIGNSFTIAVKNANRIGKAKDGSKSPEKAV